MVGSLPGLATGIITACLQQEGKVWPRGGRNITRFQRSVRHGPSYKDTNVLHYYGCEGPVLRWISLGLCSMASLIGMGSIPTLARFAMAVFSDSLQWHQTALKRLGLCMTVCGSVLGKDPLGPIEKSGM